MEKLIPIGIVADKSKATSFNDDIFYPVTHITMLDIVSMKEIVYPAYNFGGDNNWLQDSIVTCSFNRYERLFVKDDLSLYKILGDVREMTRYLNNEQVQVKVIENESLIQFTTIGSGIIYLELGRNCNIYLKVDTNNKSYSVEHEETVDFNAIKYLLHNPSAKLDIVKDLSERVQDDVFKFGDTYYFDSIKCNLMLPEDCRVAILYDCVCESIVINSNIKRIIFYNDYRYNSLSVTPKYLYIPSTVSEEILVTLLITLISGYLRKNHRFGGLDIVKIQDLYEKSQYTELLRELRTEVYASLISKSLESTEVVVY